MLWVVVGAVGADSLAYSYSRVLHVTQDTGRYYRFRESNVPRTEQQSVKFVVASSLDVRSSQLELKSSQYILIYILDISSVEVEGDRRRRHLLRSPHALKSSLS